MAAEFASGPEWPVTEEERATEYKQRWGRAHLHTLYGARLHNRAADEKAALAELKALGYTAEEVREQYAQTYGPKKETRDE